MSPGLEKLMSHEGFVHLADSARMEGSALVIRKKCGNDEFVIRVAFLDPWYNVRFGNSSSVSNFRSIHKMCKHLNDAVALFEKVRQSASDHERTMIEMHAQILDTVGKDVHIERVQGGDYKITFPDGRAELRLTERDGGFDASVLTANLFDSPAKVQVVLEALEKLELVERMIDV